MTLTLDPEAVFAAAAAAQEADEADLDAERHAAAEDGFTTLDDFLRWAEQTRERSLGEELAMLDEQLQAEALEGVDPEALLYSWETWSRSSQRLPETGWTTAVLMAGRGFGKTRVGAEWIREKARTHPGCRILLLARTSADTRTTMVTGESGILAVCPPSERPDYVPSRRELVWPNGTVATLFTSIEPSLLRGPQGHYAWADEIGTYSHIPDESGLTAWDNLRIATRLGDEPQVITTTTPRNVPAIVELVAEADDPSSSTIIVRGRTIDNVTALSRSYLQTLFHKYHGTRLWRQEILGELVDAAEGALWSHELIGQARALTALPPLPLRVVAVDPSVAEEPKDECGIIVVGATNHRDVNKRHAYVLEDFTVHGSPREWTQAVVRAAHKWQVAGVVAEKNQGGELVTMALHAVDPDLRVFGVHAKQNKKLRAEPVVTMYESRRVHHVNYLPELETQMTTWEPADKRQKSPDRVDALVYAVTAALIAPPRGLFSLGGVRARSAARRRLDGVKRSDYAGHRARRAA